MFRGFLFRMYRRVFDEFVTFFVGLHSPDIIIAVDFLLKLNMLLAKTNNIFQINFNFAITLKFSLKVCFLLLGEFLEVFSY